ncbi:DUF983 domain-containing protein [Flavobacterium sp.]|uniref:DUF983 domain-containing protein n=1 Tax=Flavobacterium sp. TaxID=239 RepID=UPI003D69FFFC
MSVLSNILKEKCPKCGKGQVFSKKGNILLLQMPKMNENCPQCHHKLEKEPGYFFGSMFVSYALIVGEMIAFFLIINQFIASFVTILVLMGIIILLSSTFNFRLSRMIWMYLLDGPNKKI